MMSGARSVPPQLTALASSITALSLRQLFASDAQRTTQLSRLLKIGDCELHVDMSKQFVDQVVLDALIQHARNCGLEGKRAAMVAGDVINTTEGRAVTHVAQRATSDLTAPAALRSQAAAAQQALSEAVAAIPAHITHVVNIGIGGSDLGPALLCDALAAMRTSVRSVRFVSNIDPVDFDRAVDGLTPANTMFVVCSKSFGTTETLANARRASDWLVAGGVNEPSRQLVAVTARPDQVSARGYAAGRVLVMPESVGGRYSVSSSVVFAVAAGFGMSVVHEVLDGMRLMDEHFVAAPLADNLPVLLGVLGWWNTTVLGHHSVAVVPYSRVLALLPAYLQQLMMESNGKSVDETGASVQRTSPIVWGGVGTNAQHAFFQLLHQGTQVVSCDFIGHSAALGAEQGDHDVLMANMFAQAQALAFGVGVDEVGGDEKLRAHRATPGNRPSNTLLFSQFTPRALGALIALYEHITFVQGVLWGVNSFDQWGVELGKRLAHQLQQDMNGARPVGTSGAAVATSPGTYDPSTAALLNQHRRWRDTH